MGEGRGFLIWGLGFVMIYVFIHVYRGEILPPFLVVHRAVGGVPYSDLDISELYFGCSPRASVHCSILSSACKHLLALVQCSQVLHPNRL